MRRKRTRKGLGLRAGQRRCGWRFQILNTTQPTASRLRRPSSGPARRSGATAMRPRDYCRHARMDVGASLCVTRAARTAPPNDQRSQETPSCYAEQAVTISRGGRLAFSCARTVPLLRTAGSACEKAGWNRGHIGGGAFLVRDEISRDLGAAGGCPSHSYDNVFFAKTCDGRPVGN